MHFFAKIRNFPPKSLNLIAFEIKLFQTKSNISLSCSIIVAQLDVYISNRKETVRQNPDCSARSLFALPTDDVAVSKTIKMIEHYLKPILN